MNLFNNLLHISLKRISYNDLQQFNIEHKLETLIFGQLVIEFMA